MTPVSTIERLLLFVDESSATNRAVRYVAKLIGQRRGFHVFLMHLLPPLPPELMEFGGSENPRKEQQLEVQLRNQQEQWIASRKAAVRPALDHAQKSLRNGGIPTQEIAFSFSDPREGRDAAGAILEMARDKHCRTIVVAHESHSWFREVFGGHLAEELVRKAKGFTVWVVD